MRGWKCRGGATDALASSLVQLNVVGREVPARPVRLPTLLEACDQAAAELVALDYDEFLVLLSGGADSTLAAAALSRKAAEAGKRVVYAVTESGYADLDQRTVAWLSAAEGARFEWYNPEKLDAYRDGMIVTGILGDELYSGWLGWDRHGLDDEMWEMSPGQFIARLSGLNESAALTERFMPVFDGMPYQLTAANMLHWLAFKYTWDRERHVLAVSTDLGLPGDRYLHFFEHLSLQHWMMHDMTVRCGRTASTRKDVGIAAIRHYVGCDVNVPQKNRVMHEIVSGSPSLYDVIRIDQDGTIHRRITP